jgi:tetratricopeptide (TPR) repeat protein
MMRRLPVLALALFLVPAALGQSGYGATEFPNSGAAEAQDTFLQGLLMLHSFEYEDAREAFQEARRIDPDFAMAAWGEAMTHNHPIWQEQDRDAAIAALGDWWPAVQDGAPVDGVTEREEDYLWTLGALYGEGSKEERDYAYADALASLSAAYPDDLDAAAFYALSILGTAHEGRDFGIYMDAAAVAEEVFAENPAHPGAAHYLIHAYDDPIHAPLGLRPARVYADLAPSASHALHMPSHIYFALGMWHEGAEMNVRSYEAAKSRTDARGERLNGHGWHALQWLLYAELQRGRTDEAERLVRLATTLAEDDDRRREWVATWPATVLAETEDWTGPLAHTLAAPPDRVRDARHHYAAVRAALAHGDRAAAEASLTDLQARLDADETPSDAAVATALELEALLALDAGDTEDALALLAEAAAVEDAMPLDFGPASPVKPVHELWGDVLLEMGEPEEAWVHFEETLARYPRRARALLGLARAAQQAGDPSTAHAVYAELADIWYDADTELPALAEVKEHAALGSR